MGHSTPWVEWILSTVRGAIGRIPTPWGQDLEIIPGIIDRWDDPQIVCTLGIICHLLMTGDLLPSVTWDLGPDRGDPPKTDFLFEETEGFFKKTATFCNNGPETPKARGKGGTP